MSLVADYTDSEEEDEDHSGNKNEYNPDKILDSAKKLDKPLGMSLLGITPDSESDSEDQSDFRLMTDDCGQKPDKMLLDNPFRNFGTGALPEQASSVLKVEFREEDAKKTAVLERHVKMTNVAGSTNKINGVKVCWNYRKGKCYKGHKCTFAHDSDIISSVIPVPEKSFQPVTKLETTPNPFSIDYTSNDASEQASAILSSMAKLAGDRQAKKECDSDSDEEVLEKRRKSKRPGVTNTLQPSKKYMKLFGNKSN